MITPEERNKATVHRLFDEVWNGRRLQSLAELYADDYVSDYRPYAPLRHGHDGIRAMVEGAATTFPDYHEELVAMVAEGDHVVVHVRTRGPSSVHGDHCRRPAVTWGSRRCCG